MGVATGRYAVTAVETPPKVTTSSVLVTVHRLLSAWHGITVETQSYVEKGYCVVQLFVVQVVCGTHVETGWYCFVIVIGGGAMLGGQEGQGVNVASGFLFLAAVMGEMKTQSRHRVMEKMVDFILVGRLGCCGGGGKDCDGFDRTETSGCGLPKKREGF